MSLLARVLCLLISYMIGTINPAYFFALSKGVDIKGVGSGNAGTTNVLRNFGPKAGIFVFFMDFIKGIAASFICIALFGAFIDFDGGVDKTIIAYSALGAIIGHSYPFYLGFKGGKGIVVTLATMFLYDWLAATIAFAIFFLVVAITRYVSLGSLFGAVSVFALLLIFKLSGLGRAEGFTTESLIIIFILVLIIFYKHKDNIKRLINHEENKISFNKKDK